MQQKSSGHAIYDLVLRRLNRRDFLASGSALAVTGLVGCGSESATDLAPVALSPQAFATIAGSAEDAVIVPEGFTYDVLMRWGDPVVAGAAELPVASLAEGSLFETGAAAAQSASFGCSCDGMGVVAIDDDHLAICINHETPEMSRMFPGWTEAQRERRATEFVTEHPEMVAIMRASVGVSVMAFERAGDRWQFMPDSPLNRRITADTPIEFSGPAAHHAWLDGTDESPGHCLGTFGNCAAGATPWGTYLTAEENTNDFFANGDEADF